MYYFLYYSPSVVFCKQKINFTLLKKLVSFIKLCNFQLKKQTFFPSYHWNLIININSPLNEGYFKQSLIKWSKSSQNLLIKKTKKLFFSYKRECKKYDVLEK